MKHKYSITSLASLIVFILMAMVCTKVQAQFTGQSYPFNTHYFFHKYPVNPAYIGEEGEANFGLGYKKANGYFETAGNRAFAYVHGKSDAMKGGGFGVLFNYMDANDRGVEHTQMTQSLMDLVDVKIGVTTSLIRYRNNRAPTGGSPTNPSNPLPTLEKFAKINLDAGLLLALDELELGFAMHHNNEPEFQFFTSGGGQNRFSREFYITASYNLDISEEFSVEPHLIVQSNTLHKDLLMQFTMLGNFDDSFFAGLGYVRDFDVNRNPNTNYLTKEFHKLRVTAAAKFAKQFLLAASLDFATSDPYKMQFETSIGYYFNQSDY